MYFQNQSGGGQATTATSTMPGAPQAAAGSYQQQPYGAYQAPSGAFCMFFRLIWLLIMQICVGYYGGQAPQPGAPPVPQGQYGFPSYGYGGQPSGGQEN